MTGCKSYNWTYCARYTPNGGHSGKRWRSVIDSIPAWHKRLLQVTILQKDAFDILQKIHDSTGTAIYIDPPYIEKDGEYIHDLNMEKQETLARLLSRFKCAQVVVSFYYHPELQRLYPDWYRMEIKVSKAIAHQNNRGANKKSAVEVLLCNHPIEARIGQKALPFE